MNIGVIGAGFTGLSASYQLIKLGHSITLIEQDAHPGGLALGFQQPKWGWSLESFYHHWFTNDYSVLNLAKEIEYPVLTKRPKTSIYIDEEMFQLDSPFHVLTFKKLTIFERLRMAAALGFLKINPLWQPLEKMKASEVLPRMMSEKAYKLVWEPQLINKFGAYHNEVSMAWFWARIHKRTTSLAYPKGGFLSFANVVTKRIQDLGGVVHFNTTVSNIDEKSKVSVTTHKKGSDKTEKLEFDKVIVTLPSTIFLKIAPEMPKSYQESLSRLKGLGAINIVLRLKKPFLSNDTYWLSICEKNAPIMAIVEHTNFMDKKHYDNEYIVYIGNYLPHNHPYFSKNEKELLAIFDPFLKKINPSYKKSLIAAHLFKAPFAQPIIPINYSKIKPPFTTPMSNVFLANIQQVYPWDRGTNYAIELGEKVAHFILKK